MGEAPAVAVLAAGRGSRFGGGKLDAPCAGKPVGRWVIDAVAEAGLPPGLLVVPPQGVRFAAQAEASGWQLAANERPECGLGSSLALAAEWALERDAPALLVLLADMPLIAPDYLARLAAVDPPAATGHPGNRAGVPALIPANLLPRLVGVAGDEGAARLLLGRPDLTMLHPPPGTLLDVDRAEDLARAATMLLAREAP